MSRWLLRHRLPIFVTPITYIKRFLYQTVFAGIAPLAWRLMQNFVWRDI